MKFFDKFSLPQKIILILITAIASVVILVSLSETYQDYYVSAALLRGISVAVILLAVASPLIYFLRKKETKVKEGLGPKEKLAEELKAVKEELDNLKREREKMIKKAGTLTLEELSGITGEPASRINYWAEERIIKETAYGSKEFSRSVIATIEEIKRLQEEKKFTITDLKDYFRGKG